MSARSIPSFRDPSLEEQFSRDGYLVVDLAPPDVIEELLALYRRLDSGISEGYYPSLMSADDSYKSAVHRQVTDLLWPLLSRVIEGYQPLLGVFMVKHPGPDTEVTPHQDWIVADESERPTISTWVPLTPVTTEAGQMAVLPGSHQWLTGLRGSPTFPTSWEAVHERVRDELMVPVPIDVGQAMVYDIRVLHGTPPNRSGATRLVSSLYAIPEGTTPVHYYRNPQGTVEGYEVASDFCTKFNIGDIPEGERFVDIPDYSVDALTFDEIADRYRLSRGLVTT